MNALFLLIASAFLGSIPFGFLIARLKGVDIRQHGSGNIGATNVARNLGKSAGITTLVLDVLKGLVPAIVGVNVLGSPAWGLALGGAAMIGHSYSPFLGFRGGKGVATAFGMVLGATPLIALGALATFILGMLGSRMVSLSSLLAVFAIVLFSAIAQYDVAVTMLLAALATLIVLRHYENIQRMVEGQERPFRFASDKPAKGVETSTQDESN